MDVYGGTVWNPEKKKILWKIGTPTSASGKLLAQWEVHEQSSNNPAITVRYVHSDSASPAVNVVASGTNCTFTVKSLKRVAVSQVITPSLITE